MKDLWEQENRKYGECISKIAALFTKNPAKWHKPDVKLHTRFSSKAPEGSLRSGFSLLRTQNRLQIFLKVPLLMQPPFPFRAQAKGRVSAFDFFVVCICLVIISQHKQNLCETPLCSLHCPGSFQLFRKLLNLKKQILSGSKYPKDGQIFSFQCFLWCQKEATPTHGQLSIFSVRI